jgi:hypothetical protein
MVPNAKVMQVSEELCYPVNTVGRRDTREQVVKQEVGSDNPFVNAIRIGANQCRLANFGNAVSNVAIKETALVQGAPNVQQHAIGAADACV